MIGWFGVYPWAKFDIIGAILSFWRSSGLIWLGVFGILLSIIGAGVRGFLCSLIIVSR